MIPRTTSTNLNDHAQNEDRQKMLSNLVKKLREQQRFREYTGSPLKNQALVERPITTD